MTLKLTCNEFRSALHNIDARLMSAEDNRIMNDHYESCLHCQEYHAELMRRCDGANGVNGVTSLGVLFVLIPPEEGDSDA